VSRSRSLLRLETFDWGGQLAAVSKTKREVRPSRSRFTPVPLTKNGIRIKG